MTMTVGGAEALPVDLPLERRFLPQRAFRTAGRRLGRPVPAFHTAALLANSILQRTYVNNSKFIARPNL